MEDGWKNLSEEKPIVQILYQEKTSETLKRKIAKEIQNLWLIKNLSNWVEWVGKNIKKAHAPSPKKYVEDELQLMYLERKNLLIWLEALEEKTKRLKNQKFERQKLSSF